jgi:hypothetical protein
MNQRVLLQKGDTAPEVVIIKAAGLTVGGTAIRTVKHVRKIWELGQQAVLLVRAEFGPEVCDEFVPLVERGVLLHKIEGVFHDTCLTVKYLTSCTNCVPQAASCIMVGENGNPYQTMRSPGWITFVASIPETCPLMLGIANTKRTSRKKWATQLWWRCKKWGVVDQWWRTVGYYCYGQCVGSHT